MNSSAQAAPTVPKRRWFDRRTPLPSEVGQHRTTAFIYGNILVLAAVVQVSLHPITGRSVVTVLATAVTTFLAHVFADVITSTWSWRTVRHAARDSGPILTSGISRPRCYCWLCLGSRRQRPSCWPNCCWSPGSRRSASWWPGYALSPPL